VTGPKSCDDMMTFGPGDGLRSEIASVIAAPPDVYLLDVAASRNGVAVAACAATRQPQHTMGTHLKKADFDEPVFPSHLGGMVELSAVA
jgi:hypothetical protein